MKQVALFAFRFRNLLAGLPLLFALSSNRWEWEHDWAIWTLAIVLCCIGILIRAWATCYNTYGQGEKKELATNGPYAYVRNPLYIGNMLILAGATIASGLAWLLPVVLGWAWLVYHVACMKEEARLLAKYGQDFLDFKARIPAWIPDLRVISREPFLRAIARQSWAVLLLLPFLLKEFHLLGF
jgi:protein-S-isoprenylcysteine O-methyltransferase Ste14